LIACHVIKGRPLGRPFLLRQCINPGSNDAC
jgi:hypothetical protein